MTLQSSGAISINDLVGEYGGSAPHALNEYYKGGGLVGNHSNNPNVPTSGTISLNNFYGANNTAPVVTDNQITLSLNGSYSVPGGKYGETRYGVVLGQVGSFSDASFTNASGSATYTMVEIYQEVSSILSKSQVIVAGNFGGQTFAQAFGYTNMEFKNGSTTYVDLSPFSTAGAYDGTNTIWNTLGMGTQFPTSGSLTLTIS